MSNFIVRKVAVLGAGVMGAQIAAHCANVGLSVLLFDLATPVPEGSTESPNAIVNKAIIGLNKLDPSPLAYAKNLEYIQPANYETDLQKLAECDLVIEAIVERVEWKVALYRQVAPYLKPSVIFVTNTSGLSINLLAESFPESLRERFCGVHFFNPPRYMYLVELIACRYTQAALLDELETFLTRTLGKGVIRTFDTPSFVANRIGVFSLLITLHHAVRLGLSFDEVDALTGTLIGRPKSATCRTADVVGLDTLAHVVRNMSKTLKSDPWAQYFVLPPWLTLLIKKGALGQKTGAGIYRKEGKTLQVFDIMLGDYREVKDAAQSLVSDEVLNIMRLADPSLRFTKMRASANPQAQFLWSIFRDVFHYIAFHAASIAHSTRDIDLAMRWGFGWENGPFELWQRAGWKSVTEAVTEDVLKGLGMVTAEQASMPLWTFNIEGVHNEKGSYCARTGLYEPRSRLPVYERQCLPEVLYGERAIQTHTVWENDQARLWTFLDAQGQTPTAFGKQALVLSFKTKMNIIGAQVLDAVLEGVARAEADFAGLVIWQGAQPFSAGADLTQMFPALQTQDWHALEDIVAKFQQMTQAIKYAQVPVVSAVRGMALGGGCEIIMHSAKVVAALESYIGLVEVGVGLIPAGGGCKEFALRASSRAQSTLQKDPMQWLQSTFQSLAVGTVTKSAQQAQELGFMRKHDIVLANEHELLFVAQNEVLAMSAAGYRPPAPAKNIIVAGRAGIATLDMMLTNMHEGGFISEHDFRVSHSLGVALCGGEIEGGTKVPERWLLDVERAIFVELLKTSATQERIAHMLKTGKPLRN